MYSHYFAAQDIKRIDLLIYQYNNNNLNIEMKLKKKIQLHLMAKINGNQKFKNSIVEK